MNIFVLDLNPIKAAKLHPDRICNKLSLEMAQMLATNFGSKYLNWGTLPKKDGTPYKDTAHPNHPCTIWLRANQRNLAWGITLGMALALEHRNRYGKLPATYKSLLVAKKLFEENTGKKLNIWQKLNDDDFISMRAMPDELKYDYSLTTVEAYKKYMETKSYFISW